jgi:membrane protein DedA with SNARE-associated domain
MDWLTHLISASGWTYALIALAVALDAVLPIIPGETVVITAAVLSAGGRLSVVLVVAAAAVGSYAGDNASYGIGRGLGGPLAQRVRHGRRGRRLTEWADAQLRRRGPSVIVGARFVPGGRTATTLTAGGLAMPWRRFGPSDAIAATVWASYTTAIGYIGGATFRDATWLAIGCSLGIALVLAALGEGARRVAGRASGDGDSADRDLDRLDPADQQVSRDGPVDGGAQVVGQQHRHHDEQRFRVGGAQPAEPR